MVAHVYEQVKKVKSLDDVIVAIDSKGGAVKLVDRLTFSHANFTIAKDWVKG